MSESASGLKLDVALGEATVDAALECGGVRPSFFVIGPPRTGTSWLHEVLKRRTLLPGPTKETRFFDIHFERGMQWYFAHFAKSKKPQRMGEVAPTYFASAEARERIARIPDAKVICIFRNPVDRVISLYRLKRAYGMTPWSFEEAIQRDSELTDTGKYATTLKLWQSALGNDRVLATVYEDLRDQAQTYMDALVDYIGIPRFKLTRAQARHVHASEPLTEPRNYYCTHIATCIADGLKARRLDFFVQAVKSSRLLSLFLGGGAAFPEVPESEKLKLYELFRPEIEELETLLNRDLSSWKPAQKSLKAVPAIP